MLPFLPQILPAIAENGMHHLLRVDASFVSRAHVDGLPMPRPAVPALLQGGGRDQMPDLPKVQEGSEGGPQAAAKRMEAGGMEKMPGMRERCLRKVPAPPRDEVPQVPRRDSANVRGGRPAATHRERAERTGHGGHGVAPGSAIRHD